MISPILKTNDDCGIYLILCLTAISKCCITNEWFTYGKCTQVFPVSSKLCYTNVVTQNLRS